MLTTSLALCHIKLNLKDINKLVCTDVLVAECMIINQRDSSRCERQIKASIKVKITGKCYNNENCDAKMRKLE